MMENMEYARQRLKDIVEKEAAEEEAKDHQQEEEDEEAKEQQQGGDDEQYDTVQKIKLVHERKHVKVTRMTGN